MQLSAAVVVFAASLPHAVVWDPVGSFHTEHQVLDEGNLRTDNTLHTQEVMVHKQWSQFMANRNKHGCYLSFRLQQHKPPGPNTYVLRYNVIGDLQY